MFVYLSKKIGIPSTTQLRCVCWDKENGYIACGGDDGLLKVFRLEGKEDGRASNLSANQALEGHTGTVAVVKWNELHQRLTSSDQNGLIIVWVLHKGQWYEEMINNRNKSLVRGMAWNSDGRKICIAYEDGGVIVGSVDGSRIWGKEIKGATLAGVAWSPDGRTILFALGTGEVHCYDSTGNFLYPLEAQPKFLVPSGTQVTGLEWYHDRFGYSPLDRPSLCICFQNGLVALLRNETDQDPICFNSKLKIRYCQWNHDGSIVGIGGTSSNNDPAAENDTVNMIEFYSAYGEILRVLRLPGRNFTSFSWEALSLRISITIDTFLYFASVRPSYKWCSFGNTIAYAFNKTDRPEACVMFWDAKNNERYVKYFRYLSQICGSSEHCLIAARTEEDRDCLILCNTLGTPIDNRTVEFGIKHLGMAHSYIVGASDSWLCLWKLRPMSSPFDTDSVQRTSSAVCYYQLANNELVHCQAPSKDAVKEKSSDPITCVVLSDKLMMLGLSSGLNVYSMPDVKLLGTLPMKEKPVRLSLNCNSSRLAVIDFTGNLTLFEFKPYMEMNATNLGNWLPFERRDVWDVCWAKENSEMFAAMEKTRMYVFRGVEPEEPLASNGYLCSFKDLEVKAVLLDEIYKNPEFPKKEHVVTMEVKSLRDTRNLLQQVGTKEATAFVEQHPHPRLWRLIAETALEPMDLTAAETAFVKCLDYSNVKFIKHLQSIDKDILRQAEVAAYFGEYDRAEKLYLQADRRDLALDLRKVLGDWDRAVQLLDAATSSTDAEYEEAWNALGNYHFDNSEWKKAAECFQKAQNIDCLAECYYRLELFDALEELIDAVDDSHRVVLKLAEMFSSVGLCELATKCYLKCNRPRSAVDLCVKLNHWDRAISLAQKYGMNDIKKLLKTYARRLLVEKKYQQAVDLFKSCNQLLDASLLLYILAEEESAKLSSPADVKTAYAAAAQTMQDYEDWRRKTSNDTEPESLLLEISDDIQLSKSTLNRIYRYIDNPWKGAESQHFWILSKKQFADGNFEAAMRTLFNLQKFEDLLDPEQLYKMLAEASDQVKCFGVCSKAYMKLESLPNINDEQRRIYQQTADDIFSKNPPKDAVPPRVECRKCNKRIHDWCGTCPHCEENYPICIATGRPVYELGAAVICSSCRHCVLEVEASTRERCPLCLALGFSK